MNKTRMLKMVIVVAAILLALYINSQLTVNFGFLGFFFLVAIVLLPGFYHYACSKDVNERADAKNNKRTLKIGIFDNRYGFMGAVLLLVLGWLCVKTLNNYFFADKHVYRNIDHHAVHFDGIRIDQPNGFVLAGNGKSAFFDHVQNVGRAVITGMNDTAVTVRLTGFTRPIYFNRINSKKRCYRQDMVNASSLLLFKQDEHLQIRMKDGGVYDFWIGQVSKDSVEYWLKMPDGKVIKTEENRFLLRGLPLSKLTRHPEVQDANFAGVHIVREVVKPLVKQKDKIEEYANSQYCVEIQHVNHTDSDNYVVAVKTGRNHDWRSLSASTDVTIQIPYETAFTIGYDGSSTRPAYFTRNHAPAQGKLALLYRLPIYHYFEQTPDKSFNNVCVTTSLGAFMDNIETMPENILLFDAFQHIDNINNIAPMTVSYVSGPTNQQLDFLTTTIDGKQQKIKAGDFFVKTEAPNHRGVSWIAGVEDMKQTSPCQPQKIKWFIILFTLALAILLFFGSHSVKDQVSAAQNTFTTLEFVAYAVTLYLVTFRWFLLWRTSVFLPVENINYFEFNGIFRNIENYNNLLYVMIGFVVVIFVAKRVIRYFPRLTNWALPESLPVKFRSRYAYIQIVLTAFVYAICIFFRHSAPWLVISLPVWMFLFNTVVITKINATFYRKDDRGWDELNRNDPPAKLFAWSVLNALCTSGLLLYIDSGFGILFFTFSLFWLSWLLHEHVIHYLPERSELLRDLMVLFIFALMLILVAYYKIVIGMMYYNTLMGALIIGGVGALVGFCVFYILRWGNVKVRIAWCIGMALLFATTSFLFKQYVTTEAKHTAQRIVVHFDQPEMAMKNIEDDKTEYRFLQAALNHMVIGEYSKRGEQVKLFGEKGHGYFKMQPHSRVGAMWNAQLTDISLVRFVIAENSDMLPFLIVFFFIFMLTWAVRQPLYHRWTRAVLIQIPLLLMVQSLLIWMANTQRFIFLGQDFPMVSINSRLALVYYFSLIIIWVVTAIYSKVAFVEVYARQINDDRKDNNGLARNAFRYIIARNEMYLILVVMFFCMLMGYLAPKGNGYASLRMTALMEDFCKRIDFVNERLRDYQDEKFKNKSKRLDGRYQGSLSNLKSFMQDFNNSEQIDTLFSDFPFGQRLWKHYVDEDSRVNNTRQVLHAHLNARHQLELKTVNAFYNRELPQPKEDEWRGSIVTVSDTAGVPRNSIVEGNLRAYRLPANWLVDGEEKTLVSSIGTRILGSEPNFVMQRGIRCAAVLGQGISIDHPNRNKLKTVVQEKRYLARNVIVNGHRTMFYPMGKSFYWISHLARELKFQKNGLKDGARGEDFNSDVELTLIPDLNQELYDILKRDGATRSSVIVANGDGNVWAMPSYDRKYQLDPNDNKQISNLLDSLDLYGLLGSGVARRIFGNQNLMNMPFGPGSSQKPLVWTAVASQVEYEHWDSLRISAYLNGWIERVGNKFQINWFNDMAFYKHKPFKPLQSDEDKGNTISLRGYMTHSSNVYNAVMAYIGSFCDFDLKEIGMNVASTYDGQSLFARWDGPLKKDNYVRRFPILNINGRSEFTLNRKIVSDDQPGCILNLSMNDMFFRSQNDDELRQDLYTNPAYGLLHADENNRHVGYAFVERSRFDSRQGKSEEELMENAIRSTAIGAAKVWYVTPWKMVEAYGRMASLNRNLHLNIVKPKKALPYEPFARLTRGYWRARPEQMKGMSDVLTLGTGESVGRSLGITSGGQRNSNKVDGFYLYAKTGTIGKGDHHRFGVIISNIDLALASEDDLKKGRYVTLYFTFSEPKHWNAYANVIRKVMNSTEFQQYMKKNSK